MWEQTRCLNRELQAQECARDTVELHALHNVQYNIKIIQNNELANPDDFQFQVIIINEHNFNVKENSYVCDHCGKIYEDKSELIAHIIAYYVTEGSSKTKLNRNRQSQECSKSPVESYVSLYDLHSLENVRNYEYKPDNLNTNITKSGIYICDHCGKYYKNKSKLIAHVIAYSVTAAKTTNFNVNRPCTYPSLPGSSKSSTFELINHEVKIDDLINRSCDHCDYKTTNNVNLIKHIRAHGDAKPYKCTMCGAKFSRGDSLKAHIRTHTGEKPFVCKECGVKYRTKSMLNVHLKKHRGEKSHECSTCGARFTTSSALRVHEKLHSGIKPFECDVCHFKFQTYSKLKVHSRIHTGEKPFVCDICNSAFSLNSTMQNHRRIHTGERPHQCPICPLRFNKSCTLAGHMRSRH